MIVFDNQSNPDSLKNDLNFHIPTKAHRLRIILDHSVNLLGFAITLALACLLVYFLWRCASEGLHSLYRHEVRLDVIHEPMPNLKEVELADLGKSQNDLIIAAEDEAVKSLSKALNTQPSKLIMSALQEMVSREAAVEFLRHRQKVTQGERVRDHIWVPLSHKVERFMRQVNAAGTWDIHHNLDPQLAAWVQELHKKKYLRSRFWWNFFARGDSTSVEASGLAVALTGTLFSVLIALGLAVPFALSASICLEFFPPDRRYVRMFDSILRNWASTPAVIFGLITVIVLFNKLRLPRSSPLLAGSALGLYALPILLFTIRGALRSVPGTIREAALAMGASRFEVTFHHVIPAATPGIAASIALATSRIIGEGAPLFMIGMIAFVADVPRTPLESATVLPMQIFKWVKSPADGMNELAAAATLVLLLLLLVINTIAVVLRWQMHKRLGTVLAPGNVYN